MSNRDFLTLATNAITSSDLYYDNEADETEEGNITEETFEAARKFRQRFAQVQAILSIAVDMGRFADVVQGHTASASSKHREDADTFGKQAIGMYEAAKSAETAMDAAQQEETVNYMASQGSEWAEDAQRQALLSIAYNMRRVADSIAYFGI